MKKILLLLSSILLTLYINAQNCPSYSNVSSSAAQACGDQLYYLEVNNTSCQGEIIFTVSADYGILGEDIEWSITSNLTSNVIASGVGSENGSFSQVYNIDPNIEGQIFTITTTGVGIGFIAGGYVEIIQNGNILLNMDGVGSSIFGPAVSISSATMNILTPSGLVSSTIQSCRKFSVPLTLSNPNFCNSLQITLPWEIICDLTSTIISTGSTDIILNPKVPSSASDLVDIAWDANTCSWEVSPLNDCNNLDVGTIFTISPNPNLPTANACGNTNQDFQVDYIGISGGANCCASGGPLVPISYDVTYTNTNVQVVNSPYGGVNNSAYFQIPANAAGGNATTLDLTFNMTGYTYLILPSGGTDDSYWVTIYVNGNPVSDIQYFTSNINISLNLANIPGGYDENSVIEIYIYPNTFSNNPPTIFTTFVPGGTNLTTGQWTANSFTVSFDATFNEFTTSPTNCSFILSSATTCCAPTTVADANNTICSGDLANFNTWISDIENTNASCVVYSSVTPVGGTTLPDSIFPSGINNTCAPINQVISAYAYCDANGSGTPNNGDTYTLISTYSLTVNPAPPIVVIDSGACGNPPSINLECNGTSILNEIGIAPNSSPCGNGVNTTNINGTFTAVQIATALGNAPSTCYTPVNYDITASCNQANNSTSNFDTTICNGATFQINGTTYGNGNLSGIETIVSGNSGGCDSIITVNVTELSINEPNLTIDADPDTILLGASSTLNATGNGTIEWESLIAGNNQTVTPIITTAYTATLTDSLGCTNTQEITVYVVFENNQMKVPDAFSPNGDGLNDVFKIVNASDFSDIELKIYNRWGALVHESKGVNHGWDGNFKLKAQDVESYVYYISAKTLNGENFVISGTVNLIR